MATAYNLHLKGFVGGADFDRNAVDKTLAENSGKPVNVLIDSLGGSLATGLSFSAAFKNHGNVNVHFIGLNADQFRTLIADCRAATLPPKKRRRDDKNNEHKKSCRFSTSELHQRRSLILIQLKNALFHAPRTENLPANSKPHRYTPSRAFPQLKFKPLTEYP